MALALEVSAHAFATRLAGGVRSLGNLARRFSIAGESATGAWWQP
jgi:hypothetical protein